MLSKRNRKKERFKPIKFDFSNRRFVGYYDPVREPFGYIGILEIELKEFTKYKLPRIIKSGKCELKNRGQKKRISNTEKSILNITGR